MKIKIVPKLSAHVLLSALVISIIISIIISSLLLLHYNSNIQWIKYKNTERVQRNLQSAITLVTADTLHFNQFGEERLDLFGDHDDSISIQKESWGVFNVASIHSLYQNQQGHKNFLYGPVLSDTFNACLFLTDHRRPVQISGDSKLTGNAYLPQGNIKAANIDGKGYTGKRLVSGDILKSDTIFPAVNKELIDKLYAIFKMTQDKNFQKANTRPLQTVVSNSFENDIQYYFIPTAGKVTATSIKGNIVLFSDSALTINSNVKIDDAIIIAPEITINANFEGSVQLIANKVIKIGKKCNLLYPSAILLLKDSSNKYQGIIEVGDSSNISGLLFANAGNKDAFRNMVELKKGSFFEGVVYVHGYLQSAAMIYGTVLTDYFLYKSIITTYENSIVDMVIDRTKLSPYFIGSALVKTPGRLKVIKWLK